MHLNGGWIKPACWGVSLSECLHSWVWTRWTPSPAHAEKRKTIPWLAASLGRHGNPEGRQEGRTPSPASERVYEPSGIVVVCGQDDQRRAPRSSSCSSRGVEAGWRLLEDVASEADQTRSCDAVTAYKAAHRLTHAATGDEGRSSSRMRTGKDPLLDHGTVGIAEYQAGLPESSVLDPGPVHRCHRGLVVLCVCFAALHW